jgi:hypothetical protein
MGVAVTQWTARVPTVEPQQLFPMIGIPVIPWSVQPVEEEIPITTKGFFGPKLAARSLGSGFDSSAGVGSKRVTYIMSVPSVTESG